MSIARIVPLTETELELSAQLNNGATGAASALVAVRDGKTANSWLDFNDSTFKTSGWTTRQATLAEVSASNAPGLYRYELDVAALLPARVDGDEIVAEYDVDGVHGVDRFHLIARDLAGAYQGAVWLDQKRGVAGTVVGVNGTKDNPVDSLADAATLLATADLIGLRHLKIRQTTGGALDLSSAGTWDQFVIEALGAEVSIALGNADVDGTHFQGRGGIELSGQMNGSVIADNCDLSGCTDLDGHFNVCHFIGTNAFVDGTRTILDRCVSGEAGGAAQAVLNLGAAHAAGSELQLRGWIGGVDLRNMDNAADKVSLDIEGHAVLGATVSAGDLVLRGHGKVSDSAIGAATYDKVGFLDGANVLRMLGIVGDNQVIAVLTKNPNGDALTQRIRNYDSLANANTDDGSTGLLDEWNVTATYDGNNSMDSFVMVRVGS